MANVEWRPGALHPALMEVTMSHLTRYLLLPLALASCFVANAAAPEANSAPAASAAPGYHVVDRIPMTDGWWDYAFFEPVHRRLFVARGNGVFKYDVDTGLMDPRFIPGSEGRAVIALPGGEQMLTTVAGYSCRCWERRRNLPAGHASIPRAARDRGASSRSGRRRSRDRRRGA